MEIFFGNIYDLLKSLYGLGMNEYLWGYDCYGDLVGNNVFFKIGLIAIAVSLLIAILYYFVINHARFNSILSWFIMMFVSCIINFFIASISTINDYRNTVIPECFYDNNNNIYFITESDCWMFGLSNFIVSAFFFFIISIIIKRWSSNCKHSPFKSLIS